MGDRVGIISLGCAKNLVDTELMLGLLEKAGFCVVNEAKGADILIVNTCGFINQAKEESIEAILAATHYKKAGSCKVLFVTGCLSQRYGRELEKEIPEVDGVLGTGEVVSIVEHIRKAMGGEKVFAVGKPGFNYLPGMPRIYTTPPFAAYLRIADGCNNSCAYCVIPSIRGPYRSRKVEDIVSEAVEMARRGIREITLVAQDTTAYGLDRYGSPRLAELLRKLTEISELSWIRIMYCYPSGFNDDLIRVVSEEEKVCRYIDLPLQHASPKILELMNRKGDIGEVRNLLAKLRDAIPGLTLRTTFMVGFPGETERDFLKLLDFMSQTRFERAGIFAYSREEGTLAAKMRKQVPEKVKQKRLKAAYELQQGISYEHNKSKVGREIAVLVEGSIEGDIYRGRSEADAMDVDGSVMFSAGGTELSSGDVVAVKVENASAYDLTGQFVGVIKAYK